MTLNQIVEKIRLFVSNHGQLKSFFEGDIEDFDTGKSGDYPCLTCVLQPTLLNETLKGWTFQVGAWDKTFLDKANRTEVFSDTELMIGDLVAYITNLDGIENVTLPVSIDHHSEKFNDDVAGSFADITINTYNDITVCSVPVN